MMLAAASAPSKRLCSITQFPAVAHQEVMICTEILTGSLTQVILVELIKEPLQTMYPKPDVTSAMQENIPKSMILHIV